MQPRIITVVIMATIGSAAVHAADLDRQAAALKEIRATAADICQTAPITQQRSEIKLTADADAKVAAVARRLANLGVRGSIGYQRELSTGVLQRDLAQAIRDGNNCKLNVFNTLQAKMLPALTPPPAPTGSSRAAKPTPVTRFNKPVGYFQKAGKVWREYPELSPGQYFRFLESGRDANYVYLSDLSRSRPGDAGNAMLVRLPLRGGEAQWSWQNPLQWVDFTVVFPVAG